ncbi:MAG: hypothetical protein BMS9Abin07_2002 [Acidimicrobiia bacterium]|nr:MAG: hypothetical protein BMS9Abin07_2002 [Acidimicrobiia bacterium]
MTSTTTADVPQREEFADLDRGVRRLYRAGWVIVGLALFVVGFVLQQLFFTSWLARANQPELTAAAELRFATVEVTEVPYVAEPTPPVAGPGAAEVPSAGDPIPTVEDPAPREVSLLAEAKPANAEAFAIIRVPSLSRLRDGWTVVEGVGTAELKTGAGHMPDTVLPGMPGNSVISGHRTTYGAPFNQLDELVAGDIITVETAIGVHTYVVREWIIVDPQDVWVTEPRPGAWLTLTTCNPEFSARERLVVFAELVAGPNWEAIYG